MKVQTIIRLGGDRFVITVGIGLLLIILTGFLRPPAEWVQSGMNRAEFWVRKVNSAGNYDFVIAGDSRTLIGISPSAMQTVLPGQRISNFGFDHNAYNGQYLEAIENHLDPESSSKTILLGITPQSLTPEAASRNGFLSLRSRTKSEILTHLYLAKYLDHFKSFDPYDLSGYLRGKQRTKYIQHFDKDGFIASRKEPEDTMYQIRRYDGRFDSNLVSEFLVSQLTDYIRDWTSRDISVYGVKLPTAEPMDRLELEESGFDDAGFVARFEAAGGIWIELERGQYHTYDGSHLHENSAKKLSIAIAELISEASPGEYQKR